MASLLGRSIVSLVLSLTPGLVSAAEGIRELNQAGIQAAGGFPVVLSSGSHALTSDLVVPDTSTTAIRIAGDGVHLDLRGFTIRGPNACGSGTCTVGTGRGVESLPGVRAARVVNGTLAGLGSDCLRLGDAAHVEGIVATGCGGDGIAVGAFGLVLANRALSNGGDGIEVGSQCLTANNSSSGNDRAGGGGRALRGGRGGGANACDDGSCSSGTQRAFYLTPSNGVPGNQALQKCAAGFHMASLFEMLDPSSLVYDASRGLTFGDSAPPTSFPGWVRTGYFPDATSGVKGRLNCQAWTVGDGVSSGTTARLREDWVATATTPPLTPTFWPWEIGSAGCFNPINVWCIQD